MVEGKENKIQEIQIIEQTLQNLILQKQAFEMELSETKSAIDEVSKSKESPYKIIGQIMIKTDSDKLKEELSNKEKILSLRFQSLEKQEKELFQKSEKLRKEIMDNSSK